MREGILAVGTRVREGGLLSQDVGRTLEFTEGMFFYHALSLGNSCREKGEFFTLL